MYCGTVVRLLTISYNVLWYSCPCTYSFCYGIVIYILSEIGHCVVEFLQCIVAQLSVYLQFLTMFCGTVVHVLTVSCCVLWHSYLYTL